MRYARTVFRPRTGMIMGIGAAVVCAIAIVGLFIEVPLHEWIRIAPALALVGVLGVVMFWLPSLTVGPEGITVQAPSNAVPASKQPRLSKVIFRSIAFNAAVVAEPSASLPDIL